MRGDAHVRFGGAGRGNGASETTTPRPGPIPTDLADTDVAYLEALQRGRGRAEKLICNLKDTGLANLPSADFAINAAWMTMALTAHDLLAWTRLVALDGDLARAEPKRLRYCLLHAAGVIARSGRRTRLRLAANWPWATDLVAAFDRVARLRLQT
jgi:Transposase DDE domain group 1